jgi:hypothetical protein
MNTTDCPTDCPEGENLCYDGTCSKETCDEKLESPCWCDPLYTACPRPIDYYENCLRDYAVIYDNYTLCVEEYEEAIPKLSYSGPVFMLCYFWIALVTAFVFCWCFYNHRLFPVEGSAVPLIPATSQASKDDENWTQIEQGR